MQCQISKLMHSKESEVLKFYMIIIKWSNPNSYFTDSNRGIFFAADIQRNLFPIFTLRWKHKILNDFIFQTLPIT